MITLVPFGLVVTTLILASFILLGGWMSYAGDSIPKNMKALRKDKV